MCRETCYHWYIRLIVSQHKVTDLHSFHIINMCASHVTSSPMTPLSARLCTPRSSAQISPGNATRDCLITWSAVCSAHWFLWMRWPASCSLIGWGGRHVAWIIMSVEQVTWCRYVNQCLPLLGRITHTLEASARWPLGWPHAPNLQTPYYSHYPEEHIYRYKGWFMIFAGIFPSSG